MRNPRANAGARVSLEGLDSPGRRFREELAGRLCRLPRRSPGSGPLPNFCSRRGNVISLRAFMPASDDSGRHTSNQRLLPGFAQAQGTNRERVTHERPVYQGARPDFAEPLISEIVGCTITPSEIIAQAEPPRRARRSAIRGRI